MRYSVKELADYTGVTRQRVNTLINKGRLSRVNGKLDSEDPLNRAWISSQMMNPPAHKPIGRSKHRDYVPSAENATPEDIEGAEMLLENLTTHDIQRMTKASIDKLKSMESMLKTQIDRKLKRRELIERSLVANVFGELYTIDSNSWKTLGSKTAAAVAGICECDDPEKVLLVEQKIDREVTLILQHVKNLLDTALKSWEPK